MDSFEVTLSNGDTFALSAIDATDAVDQAIAIGGSAAVHVRPLAVDGPILTHGEAE